MCQYVSNLFLILLSYRICRFMTAFIPSLAIRAITDGNIQYFIAAIISILVLFWTRQAIENISSMYLGHMRFYTTKNLFTRFLNKVMYTDYLNIEPQPKQKIVQRADNAVFFAQPLFNAMKYCMFPSVIARIAREGINAVIKGAPIRQSI